MKRISIEDITYILIIIATVGYLFFSLRRDFAEHNDKDNIEHRWKEKAK